MIWYDREGVKLRDSGSEIERNIVKRQICHSLPERSVVIGHGIVGKDIPIMAHLVKARRWSKR
jgi:hypothetical protein